jgi:hypothetical protein
MTPSSCCSSTPSLSANATAAGQCRRQLGHAEETERQRRGGGAAHQMPRADSTITARMLRPSAHPEARKTDLRHADASNARVRTAIRRIQPLAGVPLDQSGGAAVIFGNLPSRNRVNLQAGRKACLTISPTGVHRTEVESAFLSRMKCTTGLTSSMYRRSGCPKRRGTLDTPQPKSGS